MTDKEIKERAIIEAANYEYANSGIDSPCYDKNFYDGFVMGARFVLAQPLHEIIDEKTRQKILNAYRGFRAIINNPGDTLGARMMAAFSAETLKSIFSDTLFADIDAEAPEMPDTPFF